MPCALQATVWVEFVHQSNAVCTENVAMVQHYTIFRPRGEEHQCREAVEALAAARYDQTSL